MYLSRRRFGTYAASVVAFFASRRALALQAGWRNGGDEAAELLSGGVQRMAFTPATHFRPYVSRVSPKADAVTWLQIDLGETRPLDLVRIFPTFLPSKVSRTGYGFPLRFRVEASHTPDFNHAQTIADRTSEDFANPGDRIMDFNAAGISARYVRLTAIRLPRALKEVDCTHASEGFGEGYAMGVSKISVLSKGRDVAELRAVTADDALGNPESFCQVTRVTRPMGETIHVDNPGNVTQPVSWRPPKPKARTPRGGVALQEGPLRTALENNVGYLLESFSVNHILTPFRQRAGRPVEADVKPQVPQWDTELEGANAGRFLMGAANSLRWMHHEELTKRVHAVVEGLRACRESDGYIMAYPRDSIFVYEHAAYCRAWVTHGLLEAGYFGVPDAFDLLRGFYDWFDEQPYMPRLLRGALQGNQGMVANTRVHLSPAGKPKDIQVIQQFFQENYWLEGLAKRDAAQIWQYPYDRPHCYLLTDLEAYMDLYLATGQQLYYDAVLGGWELYRAHWANDGGSISIKEFFVNPPGSYPLYQFKVGEFCGSAFWVFLSQRLHSLHPEDERFPAEIERTIYNVALANQTSTSGLRSFTNLTKKKWETRAINHCCEGQGTRLLGSLPEHIYSIAEDGLFINQFAASTIQWEQQGQVWKLTMATEFPFANEVRLCVSLTKSSHGAIRVRIPSWAAADVAVSVNGAVFGSGRPGSYLTLAREWSDQDTIAFTLPMSFRLSHYTGVDQRPGVERYALLYGPLLMAIAGPEEMTLRTPHGDDEKVFLQQLRPLEGMPLHFMVDHNPGAIYRPYWMIQDEEFTCYPVIRFA